MLTKLGKPQYYVVCGAALFLSDAHIFITFLAYLKQLYSFTFAGQKGTSRRPKVTSIRRTVTAKCSLFLYTFCNSMLYWSVKRCPLLTSLYFAVMQSIEHVCFRYMNHSCKNLTAFEILFIKVQHIYSENALNTNLFNITIQIGCAHIVN